MSALSLKVDITPTAYSGTQCLQYTASRLTLGTMSKIGVPAEPLHAQSAIRGIVWMALAAVFFSIVFGLVRHISESINAFEQTFFRHIFGILILAPFIIRGGRASLRTGQLKLNIFRNLIGNGGTTLSFLSVTMISLTDSLTLHFTMPIFAILFALIILKERVGSHRWVAMVLGFFGVLVVLRPGFHDLNPGMLAALAAATCFGLSDVLLRKLSRTDMTLSIVFYSFIFQLPFSLPLALTNWVTPTPMELLWLAAMGAMSFGAQWSLSRAYILADASVVSPVLFIRLPIVSVIGLVFFGQVTDMWTWIGAAIIFGSTYYAARREANLRHALF